MAAVGRVLADPHPPVPGPRGAARPELRARILRSLQVQVLALRRLGRGESLSTFSCPLHDHRIQRQNVPENLFYGTFCLKLGRFTYRFFDVSAYRNDISYVII